MNTQLFKLEESDRDKMKCESFINEYAKKVRKGEDDILLKALTTYLNRTPDIEDYKRCQMVYCAGVLDEYTFCYDNFPLGNIKRSFENLSYNVTFTPKNNATTI